MKIDLVPILDDNYVFVIHNESEALVVDPGLSFEVHTYLKNKNLQLKGILLTHHHWDHTDGAQELASIYKCPTYAPKDEDSSIPYATDFINSKASLNLLNTPVLIFDLPGHTRGHIGYHMPALGAFFCGDVLFGLGCGRIMEGTFEQTFQSLQQFKTLPEDTKVYCTHEYTSANIKFSASLPPDLAPPREAFRQYEINVKEHRSHNLPTVPLNLKIELQTNPFLLAPSLEKFQKIRELRNTFNA